MLDNLKKLKSDALHELRELHESGHETGSKMSNHANQAIRVRVENKESGTEKRLAVKIRSELLAEDIWLAFGDFLADEGLVIYYPDEIEYLKTLPPEEIKRIHRIKRAFRGSRLAS